MNISQKGIDLIKEFEGCRLTAYKDAVGVWTIGYGTTNADKSITGTTIKSGMTITQATADEWLRKSVNSKYVPLVMKYDNVYHWNQNQLDALTSFAYNIGSIDQLTNYGKRTILQISEKILSYDKAGGKVLAGLTRRRKAEQKLFNTSVTEDGWRLDVSNNKYWYKYADGTYPKSEWKEIDGAWYYFHADGYMAENEFIKSSDYDTSQKLYWVKSDGAWDEKSYRWIEDNMGWWIAGVGFEWYAKNSWYLIDGKWYYFRDNGYMVTGTAIIGGKFYEFGNDGALIN